MAKSIDDVWTMHAGFMAEFGFDRLFYGLSYEAGAVDFISLNDMMVLSNHPQSYLDWFLTDGNFRHSPGLQWSRTNTGACLWDALYSPLADLCDEERAVIARNRKFGINAGVTISFGATPPCGRSVIGLTAAPGLDQSEVDAIWKEQGHAILLLNQVAHLKIVTLPRTDCERKLTPRQRAVLRLVGAGKTAPEIARIMGVSTVTIEKHLRLARQELGVETSAQALLKAAIQAQIFLPDHEPTLGNR